MENTSAFAGGIDWGKMWSQRPSAKEFWGGITVLCSNYSGKNTDLYMI